MPKMERWFGWELRSCAAAVIAFGLLLLLAGPAAAYDQYSVSRDATNCRACHGDFRFTPYVSLSDGVSWELSLHEVHRGTAGMLNRDCDACHSGTGRFPVLLDTSTGTLGLAISCTGCHGRAEDASGAGTVGYGAGLRQHHWNANVTICLNCHADSDPANYTPVGEDFLPPYYSDSDVNHPLIPSDPCNPSPDYPEDYAATTLGLDNDGDLLYDELDVIDCPEPGETLMLGVGIGALLLVGRMRTRRGRA